MDFQSKHALRRICPLALVVLAALLLVACNRPPHSSPTALRDTNAYFKATSPLAPGTLDGQALDRISLSREGDTLVATYQSSGGAENESDGFEHDVVRLKPGEKLEGVNSRLEMVAFAVSGPGFLKSPTNAGRSFPLDYFSPKGKSLSAEELKAIGFKNWELTDYDSGSYGGADYAFLKMRVVFGSTKQLPGYYTVIGLFDGKTKKSLVNGYSYSQISSNSLGRVEVHPRAWHPTPMELVLDVELDGKTVIETNLVPEARLSVPGGELKLLGVWDGDSHTWSSSSSGGPTTWRINLKQSERETNAIALFVTEPPKLAVHIELLDSRGKVMDGNGGGTCGSIRMVGLLGAAADVKAMRFTVFTNHHRVVLTLPPVPNLPDGSNRVDNLFDVRLPQVQIRREYELREIIGDVTQLRFNVADAMPTNLFPLTITNTTPALLLAEYRRHLTNGCTVVVDEQKNEIRVEPTQLEKVKRMLRRILP